MQNAASLLAAKFRGLAASLVEAGSRCRPSLMPILFGVILYRQPSALMLYWVTSNLLQLAQQWWFGSRYA